MRLYTHGSTPKSKSPTPVSALLWVCAVLLYGIFALASFACFYYAQSTLGGLLIIVLAILLTLLVLIPIRDMNKAYVEIHADEIHVVDYYFGIPKSKSYHSSQITSAEIALGYSHRVKGYRISVTGTRYIVFKSGNQYLFKILYLPENEQVFKQYIDQ